ncbi:MAG: alkaline phosphatase D family protein [Hyphomonadaceae bacterium]|nr:alkaline phosphatase D family protein [Hyphomonadaceae bacterium]
MTVHPTRRGAIAGAAAVAMTTTAAAAEAAPLTRLAFGSCARQTKDQPIWEAVLAARPELFVFLGDNVYGDTRDPAVLRDKYAMLAAKPGFRKLKETTPLLAIWDDHDFGRNDAGGDFPMKHESRAAFCDFWDVAPDSPRRTRPDGIYTSLLVGPPGRDVRIILPDLRFNRTRLRAPGGFPAMAGRYVAGQLFRHAAVAGPYGYEDGPDATMLGAAQWAWLEQELRKPAALRIIGSSLQVLSRGTGWEAWERFPADYERLLAAIGHSSDVLLLSGDVHYGELSRLERAGAPPLWDLTSSGLTEVWAVLPPNDRRVGAWRGRNFGMVEIDWDARRLGLEVRDEAGGVRLRESVPFG